MIKLNSNKKTKLLKLCMAFLFPFALFGGLGLSYSNQTSYADYVQKYEEDVSVTNSSFTQGSVASASNSITGWTAINSSSRARGMIVDVGSGVSSDPDAENSTFSQKQDTVYFLEENPKAFGKSDTRIFMINSKISANTNSVATNKGYTSNKITLNANSYYRFSIAVKTTVNGDDNVNASVYVSGLKDNDGQDLKIGYENINNTTWKEYFIFIATGNQEQSVTVDLYLGSASGALSRGAVFFDEINVSRLSQNTFVDSCIEKGYLFADNYQSFDTDSTKFLISALQNKKELIDSTGYNFDFEGENGWNIINNSNGYAQIMNMDMQPADFKNMTGYNFPGGDFKYNNTRSLALYTQTDSQPAYGFVGVSSNDIEIKAHEIYKISMDVKVSDLTSGSFYLKVKENDKIYTAYPQIISDNSSDANYYELQSGKTSGISSNPTNNFTNDYRTVTFYIKGHSLFNTSVNIELWLGDESTYAQGCAIIDNIVVEYSDFSAFSSASDKLELKSVSSSPATIANGYFNETEDEEKNGIYPVKASNWTTSLENAKNNISGVLYLYNEETYNQMYDNTDYNWAGIYPGNPKITSADIPNNVYMMFNKTNSYQSITSSKYSLSSNSYKKLSFDYYTQNFTDLDDAKLNIEIVDENGIALYKKSELTTNEIWRNAEIILHTPQNVSHNVSIKLSLGSEDNRCGGIVYLDNILFTDSDENEFALASLKANLDDYYLNLNEEELNEFVSPSPAYTLSVDEVYGSGNENNAAVGGVVNGSANEFNIQVEDSNFLVLTTETASKASLSSNFKLSLDSGKYYKLSFDLATIIGNDEDSSKYGAKVGLTGFNEIEYQNTEGQLKNYTIYIKCDESTTSALKFTLNSSTFETVGTALLTHISFETIEENEFNKASINPQYNSTVFTTRQTSEEGEENTTPDEVPSDKDDEKPSSTNTWLLVPSIITGVAVIIGALGWALRKVKIKKIEKIKTETYDRKLAVNHDEITVLAQKRRDKEISDLVEARKALEKECEDIEVGHKEYLKRKHAESNGKITKDMERTLKSFNSQKHALNEKINIINEKIANISTAEYLLTLERKVVIEQEEKFASDKKLKK